MKDHRTITEGSQQDRQLRQHGARMKTGSRESREWQARSEIGPYLKPIRVFARLEPVCGNSSRR